MVWHYGDPLREQRYLDDGTGVVDLGDRDGLAVVWTGFRPDVGQFTGEFRSGTPDCLGGYEVRLPRESVAALLAAGRLAGLWAYTARRIAAGVPLADVDAPRIPPPHRLVRLYIDGSAESFPEPGTPLLVLRSDPGEPVGFLGSSAYHHELGLIGLAYVTADTDAESVLMVDGMVAGQEAVSRPSPGRPG